LASGFLCQEFFIISFRVTFTGGASIYSGEEA
jgi:hypothetical protein